MPPVKSPIEDKWHSGLVESRAEEPKKIRLETNIRNLGAGVELLMRTGTSAGPEKSLK
jgi:hypothetical protein